MVWWGKKKRKRPVAVGRGGEGVNIPKGRGEVNH